MSSLIKFKDFIQESIKFEKEHRDYGDGVYHDHYTQVGKHRVGVHYRAQRHNPDFDKNRKPDGLPGDNHWNIDFSVNGHHHRTGKMSTAEKTKMIHSVRSSIHSFVKEHKPKTITMGGNTGRKDEAYHKLAKKIAVKHKAKKLYKSQSKDHDQFDWPTEGRPATVVFPHHPVNMKPRKEA